MMRKLVFGSFLVAVLFCSALAHAETDLRMLITNYNPHVLKQEAEKLGPEAIPVLLSYVYDPATEQYEGNIFQILSYMGKPQATKPLLKLIEEGEGEISTDRFRAKLSAFYALGLIAYKGDSEALNILLSYADKDVWKKKNFKFSYNTYGPKRFGDVFVRQAIQALGYAGKPQALAKLREIQADPKTPANWQDNLSEAIEFNEQAAKHGPYYVFEVRRKRREAVGIQD